MYMEIITLQTWCNMKSDTICNWYLKNINMNIWILPAVLRLKCFSTGHQPNLWQVKKTKETISEVWYKENADFWRDGILENHVNWFGRKMKGKSRAGHWNWKHIMFVVMASKKEESRLPGKELKGLSLINRPSLCTDEDASSGGQRVEIGPE